MPCGHPEPAPVALAEVCARHGAAFLRRHGARLSPAMWRAWRAITACRTPALGARVYRCQGCGKGHCAYHSCRHRLCPKCGGREAAEWTARQQEKLLPVPYFMITMTIPSELRASFGREEAFWYDAFFTAGAGVLTETAAEPKHLGVQPGFMGILHTWTRDLAYHPHLHFVMPGGGLRAVRTAGRPGTGKAGGGRWQWKGVPQPDFLFPVRLLSVRLRMAMQAHVRAERPDLYGDIPEFVWRQAWVVHVQPAGSGSAVMKYLARYVSRSALGPGAIVSDDERGVTYRYTESGTGETKYQTLPSDAFLLRVLRHALPRGFRRIRYYGWLHPAARRRFLRVQTLLCVKLYLGERPAPESGPPPCPHCGGVLTLLASHRPRGPPRPLPPPRPSPSIP